MVTENGYLLLKSSEHKTVFFSNPMKNGHGKNCQCGTSFDVAILIKTHWHAF